jgi:hypothetical protein
MSWARVFELWKELTGEDLLAKNPSKQGKKGH